MANVRSRRALALAVVAALLTTACAAPAVVPEPAPRSPAAAQRDFAAELDAHWNYGEPAASEARFRALLDQWPRDTPQHLEIATQIARAEGLQGRYAEADRTLDTVEAQLATMPAHVRVRYLLERGRVLNSSGAPQRAVPLFRLALELAECAGDAFYAVDAAHMLGIATPQGERLTWDLRALAMTEASSDARTRRWFAPLYNNIGWAHFEKKDPATALDYLRKALAAYETRGNPDDVFVARWAVARALRATNQYDDAARIQRELLAERERAGGVDGYVFEELAEIALARGEAAEARSWFAKAWSALHDDPSLRREPERLARMARLGGVADGGAGASPGAEAPR